MTCTKTWGLDRTSLSFSCTHSQNHKLCVAFKFSTLLWFFFFFFLIKEINYCMFSVTCELKSVIDIKFYLAFVALSFCRVGRCVTKLSFINSLFRRWCDSLLTPSPIHHICSSIINIIVFFKSNIIVLQSRRSVRLRIPFF